MVKHKLVVWLLGAAAVLLLLPWAAVTFVKRDAGMAAAVLLLYAVNPVYAIVTGIFAGRAIKMRWRLPVAVAVLFLLGAWMFFQPGEGAFVWYAAAYLVIGVAAMLSSWRIVGNKR